MLSLLEMVPIRILETKCFTWIDIKEAVLNTASLNTTGNSKSLVTDLSVMVSGFHTPFCDLRDQFQWKGLVVRQLDCTFA